jgi:hypothetical protein
MGRRAKHPMITLESFEHNGIVKLPWAKGLVVEDWIIHSVQCKMCSLIEKKEKIVGCKWDTLTKHVGCRITIYGWL